MTISPPPVAPAPGPPELTAPGPPRARRLRRLYRLALPLGLALALIAGTMIAHAIEEPDRSDPAYLSPTSAAGTDATRLAELLRARNIAVRIERRTSDALTAAWAGRGEVTLFIPAPEFVHHEYLWMLRYSPAGTRVVLVEPNSRVLKHAVPTLGAANQRWTTAVTAPGSDCALTGAGPAAVARTRYAQVDDSEAVSEAVSCYDGGLVRQDFQRVEFVAVGSADPFRADRIGEHDNARVATDLLSARPNVVWLDLHEMEPAPQRADTSDGTGTVVPSWAPTDEPPPPDEGSDEEPPGAAPSDSPSPYPPWLFWSVLALLLAVVLLALARGRRLGAPVSEPLPIQVRGAETAIGRSRLYQRAKARGPALETLRLSARRRLATALGLPVSTTRDQLLPALVAHTGEDASQLSDILYGPDPTTDDELHLRTTELLLLVHQVTAAPTPVKENPGD